VAFVIFYNFKDIKMKKMKKLNLAKKAALSLFIFSATSCNSYIVPDFNNIKQDYIINAAATNKNEGATLKVRFNFPKQGFALKSSDGVPAKVSNDIKSYAIYLVRSTESSDPTTTDPLDNALGPYNIDKTTVDVTSSSLTIINVPPSGQDGDGNDYYYHVAVRAFDAVGGTTGGGNDLIQVNNKDQGPWDGTTTMLALSTGAGVRVDDQYNIVGTAADIDVTINLQDIVPTQVDSQITLSPIAPKRISSYKISLTTNANRPVNKQVPGIGQVTINRDSADFIGTLMHEMVVSGSPPDPLKNYFVTVEAFDGIGNSIVTPNNSGNAYNGPDSGKEVAVSTDNFIVDDSQHLTFSDSSPIDIFVNLGFTSTLFAGTANTVCAVPTGDCGDTAGTASMAFLNEPRGITFDKNGNLYIADSKDHKIRKVSNGVISTIAGTGSAGNNATGPATSSQLKNPRSVAVDTAGNVYIADSGNGSLLKVDTNGNLVIMLNNLGNPQGLTIYNNNDMDSTNDILYVADTNNNVIKKVDAVGNISTFVGSAEGLNNPKGLVTDTAGNLYIADNVNMKIKKVGPAGGTPTDVTTLTFTPDQITLDNEFGVLYISGNASKIWALRLSDNMLFQVTASDSANSTSPISFSNPGGLAYDGSGTGVLYVGNINNHTVLKLY
jgi:sugar lactone lactonase YvrE